ncbi:MAG: EthD domain-containing protein [Spirochaetaceae bacterium]|nr:EthD domain-containing protein [Myxococcales bacterium]MCB9722466.1 EthD domain-containing protein [Spirochaetaceae bacterium]HPG27445.1 EthD domain-containing protein [Myxococcota bacterium]
MQKLFYLLRDGRNPDGDALRRTLCGQAAARMRESGAREITIFASDSDVAAGKPMLQVDPPICGMVSFWLEDAADRGPSEAALSDCVERIDGYLVVESRPVVHAMPTGRRTPGMKQISCITKRPDISREEFIRIWHGDHRRVAIETQSTFGYVRNEIFRPLTPDAPMQWDAFVEESFPIEALTSPLAFYDATTEAAYQANFERMMESCARFLDHGPIEVVFVSEYHLG